MYLVVIGWLYVALMMSVAESMHPDGTVLGAIVTFLLYGLGPAALVAYLMGTPLRRKARLAQEAAELPLAQARASAALHAAGAPLDLTPDHGHARSDPPDAGGHAPGAPEPDSIATVRKPG